MDLMPGRQSAEEKTPSLLPFLARRALHSVVGASLEALLFIPTGGGPLRPMGTAVTERSLPACRGGLESPRSDSRGGEIWKLHE